MIDVNAAYARHVDREQPVKIEKDLPRPTGRPVGRPKGSVNSTTDDGHLLAQIRAMLANNPGMGITRAIKKILGDDVRETVIRRLIKKDRHGLTF